jgi:hypothetical protein
MNTAMHPMRFPEEFRRPNIHPKYRSSPGDPFGVFWVPGHKANGRGLKIIAADGGETGWDHVSVSLMDHPRKCPSWEEMCIVKNLFWRPESCVVQFHPAAPDYVNTHQGCLHLWRCVEREFPTPPTVCV